MKITVTKKLLEQELGAICGCVNKSAEITSPSRYVVMEAIKTADREELLLSVANQDLLTQTSIVPIKDFLSIEAPGKCAFDGILFLKFLSTVNEGMGTVEFRPLEAGDDGELQTTETKDAEAKDTGPKVGKRLGTLMAMFGKEEEVGVQTVELNSNIVIDEETESTLQVKAINLMDMLRKVGISVGDKALDLSHINVQLKASDKLKLLTYCHSQFSIGEVDLDSRADFNIIVEYEKMVRLCGIMDVGPDSDPISISYSDKMKAGQTTKKGILISQPVKFGTQSMGNRTAKLLSSTDKFPNTEKKVDSTDFKTFCNFVKVGLKGVCSTLDLIEGAKTHLSLEVADSKIVFNKSDTRSKAKRVLSITNPRAKEGEKAENIEVYIPTSHLSLIANVCSEGEAELILSGEHSIIGVKSGAFRTYFMPF